MWLNKGLFTIDKRRVLVKLSLSGGANYDDFCRKTPTLSNARSLLMVMVMRNITNITQKQDNYIQLV